MSVFEEQPPLINLSELSKWLKNNYSYLNFKNIKLTSLNSERDKNFLLQGVSNTKYVIKISNPKESLDQLKYQDILINY